MGFTAAIGIACVISLSACGEAGRIELSDRKQTASASVACSAGAVQACARGPTKTTVSDEEAAVVSSRRRVTHARRTVESDQDTVEPSVIPLESPKALSISIPPGKTSSRRTIVPDNALAEIEPPQLEMPAAEMPAAELPAAELHEGQHEPPRKGREETGTSSLAPRDLPRFSQFSLGATPIASQPRSELPPLPPLRTDDNQAEPTSNQPDRAELALASLHISGQKPSVRQVATDVAPGSFDEPELHEPGGQRDADADAMASLAESSEKYAQPIAPSIFQVPSVIGDVPHDPAPVAELRPTNNASKLELGLKEVRRLHTREPVYRIVPNGEHVCEVVMLNPREIVLIGQQYGTMQLDFWYDSQGVHRASYSITVHKGPTSRKASMEESQSIESLIHQLFPGSRIECQREPTRLIVRGFAQNERQAINIISTIRRSQLIPVIDLIKVRAPERQIQSP